MKYEPIFTTNNKYFSFWCYFFFLSFVAGFFFLNSSKQLNNVFYISLSLPALIIIIKDRKTIFNQTTFFVIFFTLALWVTFTGLISHEPTNNTFKELKPLVYVFFLSVITFYIIKNRPNTPLTLAYVILVSATLSGILLLIEFYEPRHWDLTRRLGGSGPLSNSIWVGAAYGFSAIIAINIFLQNESKKYQLISLSLGFIPLIVMLATQSRGPFVAFAMALIYSLIAYKNKRALFLTLTALAAIIFISLSYSDTIDQSRLFKGDSHRIGIWSNAIDEISKAPIFGHGISANSENHIGKRSFSHFHNVYLTLAFHTGIIGLLLFLPLVLIPTFTTKGNTARLLKSMLIFGMIYMLFNASRVFTSPKELWLIFWIPLLLLWAHNKHSKRHEQSSS